MALHINKTLTYTPSAQTTQIAQLVQYMIATTYTAEELAADYKTKTINKQALNTNTATIAEGITALLDTIKNDLGPLGTLVDQSRQMSHQETAAQFSDEYRTQNRLDVLTTITAILNKAPEAGPTRTNLEISLRNLALGEKITNTKEKTAYLNKQTNPKPHTHER